MSHTISKTWFVTGCDSGMGFSIAETLLANGQKVVATALDLSKISTYMERYPKTAFCYPLNVTDTANIEKIVSLAEDATGGIDVLINNAGYGVLGAAEETSAQEYRDMFEVNFFGLVEVTRSVLARMRKRKKGEIFNISSYGGFAASPGWSMYASSKFAVEGFSEGLSKEVAPLGVRVTILEPGAFRTNFAGSSLKQTKLRIEDYQSTPVAQRRTTVLASNGNQPNDPSRIGLVLLHLVSLSKIPLRIPLGIDALERIQNKVAEMDREFKEISTVADMVTFKTS
jgi:short-subunit dehydrogenase